jgi:hypothetical protein
VYLSDRLRSSRRPEGADGARRNAEADFKHELCADIDGFSLHAAVRSDPTIANRWNNCAATLPARRRTRAAANQRRGPDAELRTPWREATTHLVMSPLEFIQRLAAPPARLLSPGLFVGHAARPAALHRPTQGIECGCFRPSGLWARICNLQLLRRCHQGQWRRATRFEPVKHRSPWLLTRRGVRSTLWLAGSRCQVATKERDQLSQSSVCGVGGSGGSAGWMRAIELFGQQRMRRQQCGTATG